MSKSRFLTTLTATRAPSKIEPGTLAWCLVVPLVYESAHYGRIVVPEGFETDFASVPRWPLAFLFFGDRVHAPAVVHDWLCRVEYQACRISWRQAADVFHEAMRSVGTPAWQRVPMYWAVRMASFVQVQRCTRQKWSRKP